MTRIKLFTKFNSVLLQNIVSLCALQFLNYVIPFITFPNIVRVLGTGKFEIISPDKLVKFQEVDLKKRLSVLPGIPGFCKLANDKISVTNKESGLINFI